MRTVEQLAAYFSQPRGACPSCNLRLPAGAECPRCFTCTWHGLHAEARCPTCAAEARTTAEAMGKVRTGATWIFILIPWFAAWATVSLVLYGAFKAIEVPALTWLYEQGAKTEAVLLFFALPILLLGGAALVWVINWLTK